MLFPRLVISLGIILFIALTFSGYLLVTDSEQRFEKSQRNEANTLVHFLSESSKDALVTQDFESLERFVESVVDHEPYKYAYFATANGQILAHSEPGKVSHYTDPVGELRDYHSRMLLTGGQAVTEIIHPARINEQHLANAHVGYVYDNTAFFREQAITIIMVLLCSLLLMGIVLFAITRYIVSPLRQLTAVISRSSLNTTENIKPHLLGRGDEVGLLAYAFNEMQLRQRNSFSEQKKSHARLQDSEHYNRMLFETSPIGLALCNMDGRLVDINPAFANIIGRSIEETKQLSYWEITPDDYAEDEQRQLECLNRTGRYGPYEKEYLHKDGHRVPVRLVGQIIERNGDKYTWSGVEDISAEKESEKELTEFRSALDASEDNIFLIDPVTMRFINFNRSATSALGYERSELLAMGPEDIQSNVSKEDLQDTFSLLINGEQDFVDLDTLHARKDGSKFPVEVRLSALQLEDQVTIIAVARDVTERKHVEEKLGQSAAVVQNTAEGIIITDKDSRIISVNPAFTEITGYTEDEAIGKTPRILKSRKHDREFYAEMWNQIITTGRWQGELWDRKKSGAVFPSWTTISAVVNDDDQVTNYVGVFSDISSLKQSEDKLDFLAYHDPLTNLPNRLLLSDRLDHTIRMAKRNNTMLGVLFLDLDRFKNVNDSLGHSVGDKLLEQVAIRLQDAVRQEDTVARLGGDEFVVLIEGITHASDIVGLANKLLSSFNGSFYLNGHTLFVTPSIGASVYPQDGSDSETLIRNADTAMYRAKDMGRNNCYSYSSELTEEAMERLTLESALRNALKRDEFELNYQPQFELASNRLLGVEALIRWNHPKRGQIMPDRFIAVSEESGLIVEIGLWVLRTACEQMQAWQQQGLALNVMAVNVSGVQFQRGDIVDTVASVLSASGLPPRCLELEITESIILKRPEHAIHALHKLKQLGVSISIDDFGTGYSSLSQLKHLPVDKLKIDQSFVRDIPNDIDDEAIACAVIALGQSMKLKVIAEGIETEAQREFLISQGCEEGQGYLYSRPVSVARIEKQILAGDLMCT